MVVLPLMIGGVSAVTRDASGDLLSIVVATWNSLTRLVGSFRAVLIASVAHYFADVNGEFASSHMPTKYLAIPVNPGTSWVMGKALGMTSRRSSEVSCCCATQDAQ